MQVSKVKLYPLIRGSSILQFRKLIRGGHIMAEGEEHIELKFRIYDGTDIAHDTYSASTTTVATLKQKLIAEWPQG
jgi:hypothetical protein